ncbi:MAG: OB-fold nucleic acid binding domain-containing protein [Actinomycetota bacterium]
MGVFSNFFARLKESDETRLSVEIRTWAEKVPGTTRIADAPMREPVKIAGVIKRMTVFPMEGKESLEALVSDGSGEAVVVFMGRRGIGGLTLGTHVVVDGVLGEQRGTLKMINPRLELSV